MKNGRGKRDEKFNKENLEDIQPHRNRISAKRAPGRITEEKNDVLRRLTKTEEQLIKIQDQVNKMVNINN